jgi:hypothetical protein
MWICRGTLGVSRQIVGDSHASPEDLPEADLLRVANAFVEVLEGLAVVEIRGMNRVASLAEFVSEPEEALRLLPARDETAAPSSW